MNLELLLWKPWGVCYPQSTWLRIYTDGYLGPNTNVGAGVYSRDFQRACPVGSIATNFDGEVKRIAFALDEIQKDRIHML
uniref:Ribonuclease h-like protein n=1 Tax=Triatoma infestans TaxID=30076 RepID=A0A170VA57_TRIIF